MNRSSEALEDIVDTAKESQELMARIADASEEQASGLAQVSTAVAQLDETTQQNVALVEETATASGSMNDEARSLAEIVSFFKLETSATDAATGRATVAHAVYEGAVRTAPEPARRKGEAGSTAEWDEF